MWLLFYRIFQWIECCVLVDEADNVVVYGSPVGNPIFSLALVGDTLCGRAVCKHHWHNKYKFWGWRECDRFLQAHQPSLSPTTSKTILLCHTSATIEYFILKEDFAELSLYRYLSPIGTTSNSPVIYKHLTSYIFDYLFIILGLEKDSRNIKFL